MRKYVKSVIFNRECLNADSDLVIDTKYNKCREKDLQNIPPLLIIFIRKLAANNGGKR